MLNEFQKMNLASPFFLGKSIRIQIKVPSFPQIQQSNIGEILNYKLQNRAKNIFFFWMINEFSNSCFGTSDILQESAPKDFFAHTLEEIGVFVKFARKILDGSLKGRKNPSPKSSFRIFRTQCFPFKVPSVK